MKDVTRVDAKKPIETESDYEAALAEIDELFQVEPNTPEGDWLDVLLTAVEVYESISYPIPPPSRIEAVKYWIESRGLLRFRRS